LLGVVQQYISSLIFDVHVAVYRDKFLITEPTRCTNYSKFYFGMKVCMFRTVPLSRWLELHGGTSWSCSQAVSKHVWHIALLCVQWKTPDDGQRNCPKHV